MVGGSSFHNFPTLCNEYANEEKEYIFCIKGRPFGCLVSPHIPTPTSTLVDYNLVRDIGMKMTDLQYTKFSFCGQKLRILGKISITVQTIHDGLASGSFHLKANVILDLSKNLDVESVAGVKLSKQLEGNGSNCTYSGALSTGSSTAPSTPRSSPRSSPRRSPTPSQAATPPRAMSPFPPRAPTPKSPPGFPAEPQHRASVPVQSNNRPQIHVYMTAVKNPTPLSLNLHSLSETFCNADIMLDINRELRALNEADPGGKVSVDENQVMTFVTTGGLLYEFSHGCRRCHPDRCLDRTRDTMANNCGFHGQWLSPNNFRSCGPMCRGAFCQCLNSY